MDSFWKVRVRTLMNILLECPPPPTWHPRGLGAVAPSSPCLGTLVSVASVLSDVLIVHICPCCCALHIQPPSRSHLNVHLSSFTAIPADSATPRRCSQLHCVDCYPVQPWKEGFSSTLFLHNNRTKMRTEPGVLQGLGSGPPSAGGWNPGIPDYHHPTPRVMVCTVQVAVPLTSGGLPAWGLARSVSSSCSQKLSSLGVLRSREWWSQQGKVF